MSEKLIIKNFGPIKDVEIELKRFNVIIGENSTGKSTIAKLLAVCRYFSFIINEQYPWDIDAPFERGLRKWGLNEYASEGSKIQYECSDYSFFAELKVEEDLDPQTGDIEGKYMEWSTKLFPKSERFNKLLDELKRSMPKGDYERLNWYIPTSFFENDVKRVMNNPYYLPTERGLQSVFSLGKDSLVNLSDSLFNQFTKTTRIQNNFKEYKEISFLEISYLNKNGDSIIKDNKNNKSLKLSNAASGYQSTVPVVLVINYYNEIAKKTKSFIIEEPEMNLFPLIQKKFIEFLVEQSNEHKHQFLITTHSPYTLTTLSNLVYAYQLGIGKDASRVNNIIPQKYWMNIDEIKAYRLLEEGTCRSIIDEDENLLKAEEIDEVSDQLNKAFDELISVEHE